MPTTASLPCAVRLDCGRMYSSGAQRRTPVASDGFHVVTIENHLRPTGGSKPAGPIISASFSVAGDVLVTLDSYGQMIAFYLQNNRYAAIRRKGTKAASSLMSLKCDELLERAQG